MNIEVVLTENDPKLGKRGEVVKVSSGYAQNFLFPHKKAKPATPENLKSFEQQKAREAREEAAKLEKARQFASKINALSVTIEVLVGEGEKLYGAVTSQDISEAIGSRASLSTKRTFIWKSRSKSSALTRSRLSCTVKCPPP